MLNAIAHRMGPGLAVGLATAKLESDMREISLLPILNAALGWTQKWTQGQVLSFA